MENDKFLMAAGVTAASILVGAFVFWGPSSGSTRLRQRRGQIAGLHNFGRTCFLNTLLQSLAACPQFIAWLQLHGASDKKSLIGSLLNTLEVINGTHPTLRADPYSPGIVLRALNNLGWVIPPDEHDAHELLHVMLSSLEEEAIRPKKIGCLSDALGADLLSTVENMPQPRPSSAMLSDFCNPDYDESTKLMRPVRSEAHTPDSPQSMCAADELDDRQRSSINLQFGVDTNVRMSPAAYRLQSASDNNKIENENQYRLRTTSNNNNLNDNVDNGNSKQRNSATYRSLERLSRGPGRISVWSETANIQIPHPFRGAQSSQMICTSCSFKSVVRYDKFDSITLPLPELRKQGLSLGHLLSDYIASEQIKNVACDSCKKSAIHTKSVTFAKLPACLCIHISRTTWLSSGQLSKRLDYVHFPESLSMAPYSFIQPGLSSQTCTPWGSTVSLLSNSFPLNSESFSTYTFGAMFPRNLYRLLAVVVHSGDVNSGHFVTYRRGALRNSHSS